MFVGTLPRRIMDLSTSIHVQTTGISYVDRWREHILACEQANSGLTEREICAKCRYGLPSIGTLFKVVHYSLVKVRSGPSLWDPQCGWKKPGEVILDGQT